MNDRTVLLQEVSRRTSDDTETLLLQPGVNVLVGDPNTGKTKWLQTIDYLLGDDPDAEQKRDDDLFIKYISASADMIVSGNQLRVERRWTEPGATNKVFINEEAVGLKEYRYYLQSLLGIPEVHYPQGNPYGSRTWPELGWRSLMRHVYRRQRMWNDLAELQPEVEQHASLLQLLGVADKVFSNEYGELIAKEKRIAALQLQREQFVEMLQEVSREIVPNEKLGVALTPQSIKAAVALIHADEAALQNRRAELLEVVRRDAMRKTAAKEGITSEILEGLTDESAHLEDKQEAIESAVRKTRERQREVSRYRSLLEEERGRITRAQEAGSLLADLKVTHCPACDQEIPRQRAGADECYVCGQTVDAASSGAASAKRLQFEVDQLKGEIEETGELLRGLAQELTRLAEEEARVEERQEYIDNVLRSGRATAAAMLPPELAAIDMNLGSLQERLRQIERIRQAFGKREQLASHIQKIQEEVAVLDAEVSRRTIGVDYESLGDRLSDGMSTYLNRIRELNPRSWTQQGISVQISDRDFRIRVGNANWKVKLGGTLSLYFFLAYHYSLLELTSDPAAHYPGLLIVDFPAEINGVAVADKENFAVQPFVELLAQEGFENAQMIAAGTAFDGLDGAHRLELKAVWK